MSVNYLLDTNICSAYIRRPAGLAHRFIQHSGRIAIPTIVLAELYAGAYMGTIRAKILAGISDLLNEAAVVPFCPACAEEFGKLRGDLKRLGIAASPLDLQIAAVARVHDFSLVTNNTKDFKTSPAYAWKTGSRPDERLAACDMPSTCSSTPN